MGKRTVDVDGAGSAAHHGGGFDVARLLEIANRYSVRKAEAGEFTAHAFSRLKGVSHQTATRILSEMLAENMVTCRSVRDVTYWRMVDAE